jgi:tRNA (guanine37-N1)-methyltransferase
MVLGPEAVFGAVEEVAGAPGGLPRPLVLLSPSGRPFDHQVASEYAGLPDGFSLLCGRYEGVDQRVADHLVDEELSVGDFVLAGGELAALVVVEAVVRLVPGVLGNDDSTGDESFSSGLLEYPHYTRPAEFRGWGVPDVLLSGDHGRVDRWRRAQALVRTVQRRPDLVAARGGLTDEEVQLLVEHGEVHLLREHGYHW